MSPSSDRRESLVFKTQDESAWDGVSPKPAFGSGTAPDYVRAEGDIVFEPGETAKQVRVRILGDAEWERDEAFRVLLFWPPLVVGPTILDGQGRATILTTTC